MLNKDEIKKAADQLKESIKVGKLKKLHCLGMSI